MMHWCALKLRQMVRKIENFSMFLNYFLIVFLMRKKPIAGP